jgi:hypothetical protein
MQPPQSEWQPTSQYPGQPFKADRVIGIIIMVLAALMAMCLTIFASLVVGFFGAVVQSAPPGDFPAGGPVPAAAAGMVVLVICGVAALQMASGYGIYRGQRWGFWMAIVLNVIALGGKGGGSALAIGILLYCILRLTGAIGPKPE